MDDLEKTVNKIYRKVEVNEEVLGRVEAHVEKINGTVSGLKETQLKQEGALSVLKLGGGAVLGGASIAGAILTGLRFIV